MGGAAGLLLESLYGEARVTVTTLWHMAPLGNISRWLHIVDVTPYLGLEMLLTAVLTAGVLTAVLVRDWSTKDSGPDRTHVRTPKDSRVRGPY